jgi:anti-sigma factor RsiW
MRSLQQRLHEDVWALIPWLVNERLDDRERERVERHAAQCEACRTEISEQQRLRELVALDDNVEVVPNASLHKLWMRIDAEGPDADVDEEPSASVSERLAKYHNRTRWLAAAAIVQAVALVGLASILLRQPSPADRYHTLSSGHAAPADTLVRAVFAPETSIGEVQALLARCQVEIGAGPSEAGVYSMRALRDTPRLGGEDATRCLRTSKAVRFAEPYRP